MGERGRERERGVLEGSGNGGLSRCLFACLCNNGLHLDLCLGVERFV